VRPSKHNVEDREIDKQRLKTKWLLVVMAIALLGLGMVACGGTSSQAGATSKTSSSQSVSSVAATSGVASKSLSSDTQTEPAIQEDRDKDFEAHSRDGYYDHDDYNTPNYPYAASASDMRDVAALVKHYFAAAVAEDGGRACSLIYSLFAETVPETYGLPPTGTAALHGTTCGQVVTKLFKMNHRQLVAELATLEVSSVRVNGNRGLALLHFNGIHARSINVHRERGVWKINGLLDTEVS
jgi:hypothetical protein